MLNREMPNDENFKYFEATILDIDECTPKKLKELEWNIQIGIEDKIVYDPIDKFADVYNWVIKNKEFSILDYCKNTNIKESTGKEILEQTILLNDYLKYINKEGQWMYAKRNKLSRAMPEIISFLKNIEKEFPEKYELYKIILFNALWMKVSSDLGKYIRNTMKKEIFNLIQHDKHELENFEKIQELIDEKIKNEFKIADNPNNALELISDDSFEAKKEFHKSINNITDKNTLFSLKNNPFNILNNIEQFSVSLKKEINFINNMNNDEKDKIKEKISTIVSKLKEISDDIKN